LPFNTPHSPMQVPDKFYAKFKDADLNLRHPGQGKQKEDLSHTRAALAMVENIDWNVGRLLDVLPADTVVVYTSDHGPCPSARDHTGAQRWNAGLRGEKGSLYQGAVKVPSFWRVPGVAPCDDDRLASPIDVLPTIAALVGADRPDVRLDGIDLFGERVDRDLFLQWHRGDAPERYRAFAVLSGSWKLYGDELYDLDDDPEEEHDVAAAHPEVVADLRSRYDAWFDDVSAAGFEAPRIVIGAVGVDPVLLTRQDWHIDGGDGDMGELAGWLPTTRGWWDVDVVDGDRYDIDVLLDPFTWSHPAFFRSITLSIDGVERELPWALQVTRYSFREVELPAGHARIEAWASRGAERASALYVEVARA
jgi:hypothetical protein